VKKTFYDAGEKLGFEAGLEQAIYDDLRERLSGKPLSGGTTAYDSSSEITLETVRQAINEIMLSKPFAVGKKSDLELFAEVYNAKIKEVERTNTIWKSPSDGNYFARDFIVKESDVLEAGTVAIIKQPLADSLAKMPANAITLITGIDKKQNPTNGNQKGGGRTNDKQL
jgi:hypothetical protein